MAIQPASDIVLDVVNAADPARAALAARRLASFEGPQTAISLDFDAALAEAATGSRAVRGQDERAMLGKPVSAGGGGASKAAIEFDTLLLNSMVSEMLPKSAEHVFGSGIAGDSWKSMLAEQISRQIAKSGRVPLGRSLFSTHPIASAAPSSNKTVKPPAAQMSELPLSMPRVEGEAGIRGRLNKPGYQ